MKISVCIRTLLQKKGPWPPLAYTKLRHWVMGEAVETSCSAEGMASQAELSRESSKTRSSPREAGG